MQRTRKLTGADLDRAIRARYGSAVTRLASRAAALPPGRIGYVTNGRTTTFFERTTGRRFYVRVVSGRIETQNVKPLAFVF